MYDLHKNYGVGYTSNTKHKFYFNLEDYNKIKHYCWFEGKNGYVYAYSPNRKMILQHRLIMNVKKDKEIDHINHNTLDNRRINLRICTRCQNMMNVGVRKDSESHITGVYFDKQIQKWAARIIVNKQEIYLGSFTSKIKAANVRRNAENKYFREWSYNNSINYSKKFDLNTKDII